MRFRCEVGSAVVVGAGLWDGGESIDVILQMESEALCLWAYSLGVCEAGCSGRCQ